MTGYGYGEQTSDFGSLSVEIRGYNSRFLELNINLPSSLMVFEQVIREYLTARCERGKVDVTVRLRELVCDSEIVVDTQMALSYYKALHELSTALGLGETPRLATIVSMEGVLQVEKKRDPERYRPFLTEALEEAMHQFEDQRIREGQATAEDILRHVETIEASLAMVQGYAPQLEEYIKKNLRQRFQEVMGDLVDENRILAETAVLLMKYTI
ncbi:MAG: YicC family protein [Treponemataceae bacterium]|nr:YicC family protein [Treponemataceae bacterium]